MDKNNYTCPSRSTDLFSSDFSRRVNRKLGVENCDSVSMTTARGFKNSTGINISDDAALDIVHGGMLLTGASLATRTKGGAAIGLGLFLLLVALYAKGR